MLPRFSALLVLVFVGCQQNPAIVSTDGGTPQTEMCDIEAEPEICYDLPKFQDGTVLCGVGTRYCRGGIWSACETTSSFLISQSNAIVGGPVICNPCNPSCSDNVDRPTGDDLTPENATDVVYDPSVGGIIPTPMTPPTPTDTDGDGVPDDADDCPAVAGVPAYLGCPDMPMEEAALYHVLPMNGGTGISPVIVPVELLSVDIYFLMDTTGSMQGEIDNLRNTITTGTFDNSCPAGINGGLVGAMSCIVPNSWFGVGSFDDYRAGSYGGGSDEVFTHLSDLSPSPVAAQTAVNGLAASGGADWPESASQALYALASGNGLEPFLPPRTTCPPNTWGYPCFRENAVPVVLVITDAPVHNGPNPGWDYDLANFPDVSPPPATFTTITSQVTVAGDITNTWTGWTGNTCGYTNSVATGCNSNSNDITIQFTLTAPQTVRLSLLGSTYDSLIGVFDAAFNPITCQDDTVGTNPQIDVALAAGTYHAVVEGWSTRCGDFELQLGVTPAPIPSEAPVTYNEMLTELTNRNVNIIGVTSDNAGFADLSAIGLATNSVDSAGASFTFPIAADGTGLGPAVVDAVWDLANNKRFDINAVPIDNPATPAIDERDFVLAIVPQAFPPGRCAGIAGTMFIQCLLGTVLDYEISFQNDFVTPMAVTQVFNFTVEIRYDGVTQRVIPIRIVVPPQQTTYAPGEYSRVYDVTESCEIPPDRPIWETFEYVTSTPSDSSVVFQFRTSDSLADLDTAMPFTWSVPANADISSFDLNQFLMDNNKPLNNPYMKVTALLNPSADTFSAPVLTSFSTRYRCEPME